MIEVFVLTNGNSQIGMGHILRSLMLVKLLKAESVSVTYFSFDNDVRANEEIRNYANLVLFENKEELVFDPEMYLEQIQKLARKDVIPLLYIDSDLQLFYSESFQKSIVNSGVKLMYATLYNQFHYYAHILLNQNILALSQVYKSESYTKRLLGPKYFLWPKKANSIVAKEVVNRDLPIDVFINFGNADPNDLTSRVLDVVVSRIEYFSSIVIVVGALYQKYYLLQDRVRSIGSEKIKLHHNISNMYELMSRCNLGISSLGLTYWELTYMGVPSLILSGSDRERPVCEFMGDEEYAFRLGDHADSNWLKDWASRLDNYFDSGFNKSLRTKDLKGMINVNGPEAVVKEMISLGV